MDIKDLPDRYQRQAELKIMRENGSKGHKKSKYGNIKTNVDGITFDSKKEARRFKELALLLEAGDISDLVLQRTFTLAEAFTNISGERIRSITYIADFVYTDAEGNMIIEDVKSPATRENALYKIKKKLMAGKGYSITEV